MSEMNIRSPQYILIILLLIFILPMLFAIYFYKTHQVSKTVNYGQLISPTENLAMLLPEANQYKGSWILLYLTDNCDKLCTQNLYNMRQVRMATGKEMNRITRMVITTQEFTLPQDYQGTIQKIIPNETLQQFSKNNQSGLYLVDPLGNMVLHYPPEPDPRKMLKDITRLLRVSQIG